MPETSNLLLLDVFHLTLAVLVLGLIAFEIIRRTNPLIRWHEHGNVWTEPFREVDLGIFAVLVGLFYYGIRTAVLEGDSGKAATDVGEVSIVLMVLVQSLGYFALLGGIIFVITKTRGVNVLELFGLTRLPAWQIAIWSIGIMVAAVPVLGFAAFGWNYLLENALGKEQEAQEIVEMFRNDSSPLTRLAIAFSACVIAPIAEEILFRGIFYATVKRFSDRFFAAITVSLVFALIHMNLGSLVPLFLLAMAFTIAYELTGCLFVPIAMHAIFNTTMVFLMFVAPVGS